jgi:hypothetical protein
MGEVIAFDRQRFSSVFPSEFQHVEEYCWNLLNDLKRANIQTANFYCEFDRETNYKHLCLKLLPKHHTQMIVSHLIVFSYQQQLHKHNVDLVLISHGACDDR